MPDHRLPTRVLIVSHSYFMRDTRPRRHAQAFVDAGWEVDVLCARDEGEPKRERVGGVDIRRLPARRRRGSKGRYAFEYASFGAMAVGAIGAMHLRRRYDVVYVFGIPNLIVRSALVPHMTGTRIILDMRDPLPEFFQSRYGFPDDHRAVRALLAEERISCRYATHVLTVIDAMRDLFLRSVAPEKITVVRNAPDPRLFSHTGELPARDPADRTMLYAGTVAERYGVDLIVRALARLKDAVPGIRARIVGDGDLVPRLREIARTEGIEDRVVFDGPVPLDAMPGIISTAWLGAQPHRADPLMRYSFSTKLLEWTSLGLPVVTAATESVVREFSDDEMMLIPPGDLDALCERIVAADRDPAALERQIERGKAAAGRFDWNAERERLLAAVSGFGARRESGRAGL